MDTVFVDANIFIYVATEDERYVDRCEDLLDSIEAGRVKGFTSVLVLNEVVHKLMTLEIAEEKDVAPGAVMQHIRNDSSLLGTVSEAWNDLIRILSIDNLSVLDADLSALVVGSGIAREENILITDSMHLATLEMYGIDAIATTDGRMDDMETVTVWHPGRDSVPAGE